MIYQTIIYKIGHVVLELTAASRMTQIILIYQYDAYDFCQPPLNHHIVNPIAVSGNTLPTLYI